MIVCTCDRLRRPKRLGITQHMHSRRDARAACSEKSKQTCKRNDKFSRDDAQISRECSSWSSECNGERIGRTALEAQIAMSRLTARANGSAAVKHARASMAKAPCGRAEQAWPKRRVEGHRVWKHGQSTMKSKRNKRPARVARTIFARSASALVHEERGSNHALHTYNRRECRTVAAEQSLHHRLREHATQHVRNAMHARNSLLCILSTSIQGGGSDRPGYTQSHTWSRPA